MALLPRTLANGCVVCLVLRDYGPSNFGAIVSDNGGGCEKGRNLVLDDFPHMIEHRYMMHGFALTMGSVFGHKLAIGILKKCKAIVTTVTSGQKLTNWLRAQIADLKKTAAYKHLAWLVQAATTRFTSVYNCMRSVLHLEIALRNVVSNNRQQLTNRDASERQKALVKVVEDRAFWSDLAVLTPVAKPFNKEVSCTSHKWDSLGLVLAPTGMASGRRSLTRPHRAEAELEAASEATGGIVPMVTDQRAGACRLLYTVSKMGLVRSHNRVSPPEDEEFKPKEVKDPGPSKQRSKVDDTDMGPLEVSDLDLYRACNPAPSAQQSATRTEEELEASLTAARELEAEEDMRFVANAETFTQMMLNIELEYDLASPIWEGEYVTMDTAPEIPALGQEDDAVPLDVDRDDLFAKLTQGM
ncbi:hypothetical protein WJX77_005258 [Trebouxia sp. C0004]